MRSARLIFIVFFIFLVLISCLCVCGLLYVVGLRIGNSISMMAGQLQTYTFESPFNAPTQIPFITSIYPPEKVTPSDNTAVPSEVITNNNQADEIALETERTLKNTNVPESDLYNLATRFKHKTISSTALTEPLKLYRIGDQRKFWVLDTDANTYTSITAQLVYITPHLYFWIENKLPFDENAVEELSLTFENHIYPTDREFFGSESTPGIDNDVHLSILFTHGMGSAAGYFSSSDTVIPTVDAYSNMADMFYLSADYLNLSDKYTYAVMAHEFQHLIQWFYDRNETSWISEGSAELAVFLNGYDIGGFDRLFALNPDLQLNDWPGNEQGDSSPHYGAAFMFLKYFLDRFGEKATKALVANPLNDLASVDAVLKDLNVKDPQTQQSIITDELFRDWTIANYLQDPKMNDGRFDYKDYKPPVFNASKTLNETTTWQNETVKQYGTDYYEIKCINNCRVEIQGQPLVKVLPVDPYSGNYYIWSNKGDMSDMSFSHEFDFSQVKGPITLKYYAWYDIEKDYDYGYLAVKNKAGNWTILKTPGCTESNPTGANYSCGYSGKSNGWVEQTVDLSQFEGEKILLQFEYVTDLAVNGEGFLVDDLSIPEIGYSTDFEKDLGGWSTNGFVRIKNELPQKYLITLIEKSDNTKISHLEFDQNHYLDLPISDNSNISDYVLIISGDTRYTRIPAEFKYRILPM